VAVLPSLLLLSLLLLLLLLLLCVKGEPTDRGRRKGWW
jgi:hypothetical protein